MKKTIFVMMLMAAMLPVSAQDTMFLPTTPMPNYWPGCQWMTDNPARSHLGVIKALQACYLLAYGYEDEKDTLRVVGLAGIMDTMKFSTSYTDFGDDLQDNMDARVPEYLCLLLPGPTPSL